MVQVCCSVWPVWEDERARDQPGKSPLLCFMRKKLLSLGSTFWKQHHLPNSCWGQSVGVHNCRRAPSTSVVSVDHSLPGHRYDIFKCVSSYHLFQKKSRLHCHLLQTLEFMLASHVLPQQSFLLIKSITYSTVESEHLCLQLSESTDHTQNAGMTASNVSLQISVLFKSSQEASKSCPYCGKSFKGATISGATCRHVQ